MIKKFINNSKSFYFVNKYRKEWWLLEDKTEIAYRFSLFLQLKNIIRINCKNYYHNNSFNKLEREIEDKDILTNSKMAQSIKNLSNKFTKNIRQNYRESKLLSYAHQKIRELYFGPFKQISIILFIAIFLNICLLVILKIEVPFYGWLLRLFLLIITFCGLSYTGNFTSVLKNSAFFKIINKSVYEK